MKTQFYQVGGSVRDEILGVKSKDIDYAVEANSYEEMRNSIIDRGGEIFLESPRYFTIRAYVPKLGSCDYVLCRKESEYSDGRHPDKVMRGTIYDDLARRDFTMNAIAKDDSGNYIDPFNGINDINNKIIKCVGNTKKRMTEDYLRLLRAIRFSVTKNFKIDSEISELLSDKLITSKLLNISIERISSELNKAFKSNTVKTIELLYKYDLANLIFNNTSLWITTTLKNR